MAPGLRDRCVLFGVVRQCAPLLPAIATGFGQNGPVLPQEMVISRSRCWRRGWDSNPGSLRSTVFKSGSRCSRGSVDDPIHEGIRRFAGPRIRHYSALLLPAVATGWRTLDEFPRSHVQAFYRSPSSVWTRGPDADYLRTMPVWLRVIDVVALAVASGLPAKSPKHHRTLNKELCQLRDRAVTSTRGGQKPRFAHAARP